MNTEPYEKMSIARKKCVIYFDCYAPDELFGEWETLPDAAKQWYETHKLNCEGTGNVWAYCIDCPFCEYDNE